MPCTENRSNASSLPTHTLAPRALRDRRCHRSTLHGCKRLAQLFLPDNPRTNSLGTGLLRG